MSYLASATDSTEFYMVEKKEETKDNSSAKNTPALEVKEKEVVSSAESNQLNDAVKEKDESVPGAGQKTSLDLTSTKEQRPAEEKPIYPPSPPIQDSENINGSTEASATPVDLSDTKKPQADGPVIVLSDDENSKENDSEDVLVERLKKVGYPSCETRAVTTFIAKKQ